MTKVFCFVVTVKTFEVIHSRRSLVTRLNSPRYTSVMSGKAKEVTASTDPSIAICCIPKIARRLPIYPQMLRMMFPMYHMMRFINQFPD